MKDLKLLLLNPFPHRISPYAELLREKSDRWIKEEYSRLPSSFCEKMKKLNPGYWAAHCWPDAPLSVLEPITRVLLWGVAYDDYYAPLKGDALSAVTGRMMEIARGATPAPEENPLSHQFSCFLRAFEVLAPDYWMERYIYDLSQYLESIEIDARISYRKDIQYPSIKEYIPIRYKGSASAMISCKIELETGILPDFIIVHPFVQKARRLAGELMGWGNDLISVEKELREDEALNLVLVIKNEKKCSIDDAFYEAVKMYNEQVEAYLLLYHNIPDFGAYTPLVKKFLEGHGIWLSGMLYWFECTDRY